MSEPISQWVNDIHSQANRTSVAEIVLVKNNEDIRKVILRAKAEKRALSIAGGRHAMGGQQFGTDTLLVDMSLMNRVQSLNLEKGLIVVEAGIQWPELTDYLITQQQNQWPQWGIRQKQTGGDRLSIGGSLSANIHGRGLLMKPFIDDIESFTLMDASGQTHHCSRNVNTELFRLSIGGYGLFGVILTVTIRLSPRKKVERVVEILSLQQLIPKIEQSIRDGFLYGDFQYDIDPAHPDFLARGVFSCYRPVDDARVMPAVQKELSGDNWDELYYLAHAGKAQAWDVYSKYYLSTSGQLYWSDLHQMSVYNDRYHEALDQRLGSPQKGSEMISEFYVPRHALTAFMKDVQQLFRNNLAEVIYGTIRFIEKENESFLNWAKESYACVIFNLHFVHTTDGMKRLVKEFRALIDLAIEHRGRYYLTYHRFATPAQVQACYPQLSEFLRMKKTYDPDEMFQSDWYRHYKQMFESPHAGR